MFREMNRRKQQLSQAECIEILKNERRGVPSAIGDDGCLYFHSGRKGHRNDAMARCDKASFCVYDRGFVKPGDWALNIRSVIAFGRLEIVEDHERALEITRKLSRKFTTDEAYIDDEVRRSGPGVLVFRLIPEHMTGKLVNEK